METDAGIIYAQSRRQAMEWSLVLASQGIEAWIDRLEDGRWVLLVSPGEHPRAMDSIRQYRVENRRWNWHKQVPGTDLPFHGGVFVWTFVLLLVHQVVAGWSPGLEDAWIIKSQQVREGEWWRLFTAMGLHADLAHLMANLSTGTLFLGIAMSRFGAGFGLLAAFLAGAMGNVAGLFVYSDPYRALGASGMVMGALGLVTVQSFSARPRWSEARVWIRALVAGLLLFVLLGLNPSSDVVAHLGGFVGGLFFGLLFVMGLEKRFGKGQVFLAWMIFLGLLLFSAVRGLL
jgi:rhomboid protease GluP